MAIINNNNNMPVNVTPEIGFNLIKNNRLEKEQIDSNVTRFLQHTSSFFNESVAKAILIDLLRTASLVKRLRANRWFVGNPRGEDTLRSSSLCASVFGLRHTWLDD